MKTLKGNAVALTIVATGAIATAAHAGNESRYEAYPLTSDTFEVIADFTENAIYWCGASLFAQLKLAQPVTQRIYVLQGPSRSETQANAVAVKFGLHPPASGAVTQVFTNDVDIIGNSLSVAQARGGCSERSASG